MHPGNARPAVATLTRSGLQNGLEANGLKVNLKRSVRTKRNVAILVFTLAFSSILLFALSRKPAYQAQSLIYIKPDTSTPATDVTGGTFDSVRYESYMQQQVQTILRTDILSAAIRSMRPGLWQYPGEPIDSSVARLRANLKVEHVTGGYELAISMSAGDPNLVSQVVNSVTDAYLNHGRFDELGQTFQQLQALRQDRDAIGHQLMQDRQEQAALSSSLGVADAANTADDGDPFDRQLEGLRKELIDARAAHDRAIAELASVQQRGTLAKDPLETSAADISAKDSGLLGLKASISARRTALVSQMAGLTPSNPVYQQDRQELASLDNVLKSSTTGLESSIGSHLLDHLQLEVQRTGKIQSQLQADLARQTSSASGLAPKLQRAADLSTEVTRLQQRYGQTDNAIHALELRQTSGSTVFLSLRATPPTQPLPSHKGLLLALALPLALCCGAMASILALHFDRRIYVAEDLSRKPGVQPMAVVPRKADVGARVMDEFMLRFVAGLDGAHRTGGAVVYVFTSITPGLDNGGLVASAAEGMRRIGYSVQVLPGSSVVHTSFNTDPGEVGSSARCALGGRAAVSSERPRTESAVAEYLDRLKSTSDLVFVDGLPLLASGERELVARLADITVLIARSGYSIQREFNDSLALIERFQAGGVAVVLTEVRPTLADDSFRIAVQSVSNCPVEASTPNESYGGNTVPAEPQGVST